MAVCGSCVGVVVVGGVVVSIGHRVMEEIGDVGWLSVERLGEYMEALGWCGGTCSKCHRCTGFVDGEYMCCRVSVRTSRLDECSVPRFGCMGGGLVDGVVVCMLMWKNVLVSGFESGCL